MQIDINAANQIIIRWTPGARNDGYACWFVLLLGFLFFSFLFSFLFFSPWHSVFGKLLGQRKVWWKCGCVSLIYVFFCSLFKCLFSQCFLVYSFLAGSNYYLVRTTTTKRIEKGYINDIYVYWRPGSKWAKLNQKKNIRLKKNKANCQTSSSLLCN